MKRYWELINFIIAIYKGSVNDPTSFPAPSRTHGSYHWAFERLLSAALVPMTVTAFATSGTNYPVLDGILGLSLIIHSHIGVCTAWLFQTSSEADIFCLVWLCCCRLSPSSQVPYSRSYNYVDTASRNCWNYGWDLSVQHERYWCVYMFLAIVKTKFATLGITELITKVWAAWAACRTIASTFFICGRQRNAFTCCTFLYPAWPQYTLL